MISFAGGYPASDLFDTDGLQAAAAQAWQVSTRCLQYGPTDGLPELKTQLLALMARRGVTCTAEEMLVTTGSQQGLDLLLRILLAPGDTAVTEQPAYPATLQALRLQQANIVTVPVDGDGIDVGVLAARLDSGAIARPKLLYTVPTFANPTGATLTRERRLALLRLAVQYRFVIVEDDPYGDLRFAGAAVPSMLALASEVEGARDWVVLFFESVEGRCARPARGLDDCAARNRAALRDRQADRRFVQHAVDAGHRGALSGGGLAGAATSAHCAGVSRQVRGAVRRLARAIRRRYRVSSARRRHVRVGAHSRCGD